MEKLTPPTNPQVHQAFNQMFSPAHLQNFFTVFILFLLAASCVGVLTSSKRQDRSDHWNAMLTFSSFAILQYILPMDVSNTIFSLMFASMVLVNVIICWLLPAHPHRA